MTTFVK